MKYPVHEIFKTFQGEGLRMGQAAWFIRLFGCPVHCPWCDSAGTWHPDYIPNNIEKLTEVEIADTLLEDTAIHFVVITGGEPAIHDLRPLVIELQERGYYVALETSGTFSITACPNLITLSPKKWKLPLSDPIQRAHEFKIIVETPEDIPFYQSVIAPFKREVPVWLHPEWSKRDDPVILVAIAKAVMESGDPNLRAGWQIHKLYQVDGLDPNSRESVPLGGNLEKGY